MSAVNAKELVTNIKKNLVQKSCSSKDEDRVMQAMLNDKKYVVDVYGKEGKVGEYCPSADARNMISSVIQSTTKISKDEASVLAEDHEFSKAEAQVMVNISKEFVNTYLGTGRKIAFGNREKSSFSLIAEDKAAGTARYPKLTGEDANGKPVYETAEVPFPAHTKVVSKSPCPVWVK